MDDYSLVPVEHQPDFENASLVPVDHDPFGADGITQQAQFPQPQTQAQQAPQTQPQAGVGQPPVNEPTSGNVPVRSGDGVAGSNAGSASNNPTLGSASGSDSSSAGKALLQGTINALVPGAYHSGLAQQQFRQGNYGAATLYGVEALADAILGIGTFGASTRFRAGVGAAETLTPAVMDGVGRITAKEADLGGRALKDVALRTPAARAAKKGYAGIGTTVNGGPTFAATEHLYPAVQEQRSVVNIPLTGSYRKDFALANKEGKFAETPDGYMWHHVDDFNPQTGKATFELIDVKAHNATRPHAGSVAQYAKHHGVPYKR
jgi:hypothetical protein